MVLKITKCSPEDSFNIWVGYLGYSTTQVALVVKNLPASSGDTDSISGQEDTATRSSILAWRIPWTGEPGGLWSVGPQSWTRLKWLSIHAHRFFYAPENIAEENFRHHLIIFKYSEDKAGKWCSQQESGRSRTRTQGLRLSIKHSLYKWVSLSPHRLLAQDPSMGHQQRAGKWMSGPGVASPCSGAEWWCLHYDLPPNIFIFASAVFLSLSLKSDLWWQLPGWSSGGLGWRSQQSHLKGRDIALLRPA